MVIFMQGCETLFGESKMTAPQVIKRGRTYKARNPADDSTFVVIANRGGKVYYAEKILEMDEAKFHHRYFTMPNKAKPMTKMEALKRQAPIHSIWNHQPVGGRESGHDIHVIDHINNTTCKVREGDKTYQIAGQSLVWDYIRVS